MSKNHRNNILLIGGSGFIGLKLIEQLAIKECKIVLLIRSSNDMDVFKEFFDRIDIIYGTLHDFELIQTTIISKKIDTIIHLASSLIPSSNFDEYLNEMTFVIYPTMRLLPLFAHQNCKLYYFSSGGVVYGNSDNVIFNENDKTCPINYYGMSKKIMEESILFESRNSNLKYIILRPSNPYGIGQNFNGKQGLIAVAIGSLLNKRELEIWGDGTIVRDYIYIDELINSVIAIILSSEVNQIYNIGSGIGYSINDIIEIINKNSLNKLNVKYITKRKVDTPKIILDTTKFKNNFSIKSVSIEEGIKCFLNYALNTINK